MAAISHLAFLKYEILTTDRLKGLKCIMVPNFMAIYPTIAELSQFNNFSKWQPSASLDFYWQHCAQRKPAGI